MNPSVMVMFTKQDLCPKSLPTPYSPQTPRDILDCSVLNVYTLTSRRALWDFRSAQNNLHYDVIRKPQNVPK